MLSWTFSLRSHCSLNVLDFMLFYFDIIAWSMSLDGIVGEDEKYVLQCELSTSVEFGGIFPRLVKY